MSQVEELLANLIAEDQRSETSGGPSRPGIRWLTGCRRRRHYLDVNRNNRSQPISAPDSARPAAHTTIAMTHVKRAVESVRSSAAGSGCKDVDTGCSAAAAVVAWQLFFFSFSKSSLLCADQYGPALGPWRISGF